jgi:ornithine carbamoyltransferase
MAFNLRNRNFVKLLDFTPEEIKFLLKLSADLKAAKYGGYEQPTLTGKNIALIFEKSSTSSWLIRTSKRGTRRHFNEHS